jgi:Zn-dependent protease
VDITTLVLLIPPILLALTFHEYMHGRVAYRLGDPTAYYAGRLSMNPLVHLDPIGTLMLFIVHFGWAKPVPVDSRYFHNPKRDLLLVAAAGPAANMLLALLSGSLVRLTRAGMLNFIPLGILQPLFTMFVLSLQINLALAIFNLLPIPPLDGSRILTGLLPAQFERFGYQLERYGGYILMVIIIFGLVTDVHLLGFFINPFVRFFSYLLGGI